MINNNRKFCTYSSIPSDWRSAPFDASRRWITTCTSFHGIAYFNRDLMPVVPWNPNHQRWLCILRSNVEQRLKINTQLFNIKNEKQLYATQIKRPFFRLLFLFTRKMAQLLLDFDTSSFSGFTLRHCSQHFRF